MDFIIKPYKVNNKEIYVVRDDLLPFGTKQRAGVDYLKSLPQKEIIYCSPPNGMGQLALAQCGKIANKKIIIFSPYRINKHKLTKEVEKLPNTKVFIKKVKKFSELYSFAQKYQNEHPNSKLLDLGFFDKKFIDLMVQNIKQHWPHSFDIPKMWIVGGSGTLLNALYLVFPKTHFNVVQVGHQIWEEHLNHSRTTIIIPPQKFEEEVQNLPPYPSSRTYNAKIWQFLPNKVKNGDYVWNVAGEINDLPLLKDIITEKEVLQMFSNLKKYKVLNRISFQKYQIKNISNKIPLLFNGKPTLIINKDTDFKNWNELSSYFTEECRMKCEVIGKNSPEKYWEKHKNEIYEKTYETYKKVNIHNLRETLFQSHKQCTSFRPNIIKSIIDLFQCHSVLDFSSGWGDRLIGAISSNVDYVGIDPNKCLIKGYQEIIKTLGNSNFKKYQMINGKAENVKIPNRKYDLVFTSPPYFDIETYTKNKSQSLSYGGEKEWYNKFLLPVLKKVWDVLIPSGIMAININQKQGDNYIEWMLNDVGKFINCEYLGVISYANEQLTNPQPIWIWIKK